MLHMLQYVLERWRQGQLAGVGATVLCRHRSCQKGAATVL